MNFYNTRIKHYDNNYLKRCALEMIHIKTDHSINFRTDTQNLLSIYGQFIETIKVWFRSKRMQSVVALSLIHIQMCIRDRRKYIVRGRQACLSYVLFTFPFYYYHYRNKKAGKTHTHTHTHTPVSYTHLDVYKRQHTHRQTHTHFSENDFFHVLSVVQSESAIISNMIFFAITILPFP